MGQGYIIAALLVACMVKSGPGSEAIQRLQVCRYGSRLHNSCFTGNL